MQARRGHLSRKVPNVKLRPQPAVKAKAKVQQYEDEDFDEINPEFSTADVNFSVDVNVGTKPFTGIVVCCSGVSDKKTLSDRIMDMGGTMTSDFTSQTTHLVTNTYGSAKYNCAVERRVPILGTAWVKQCHATWLTGSNVSLRASLAQYRLSIFSNLRICISGETDSKKRSDMGAAIQANGGLFAKDLDRDVTHVLICGETVGRELLEPGSRVVESEKAMWARKINSERKKKAAQKHADKDVELINVVWEEWFWDCMTYEGRWPEAVYDTRQPRPTRKVLPNAGPSFAGSTSPSFQSLYESTPLPPKRTAPIPSPKNSFAIGENEEEEMVSWKKADTTRKNPGMLIWEEILKNQRLDAAAANSKKNKDVDRGEPLETSSSTRPTKSRRQDIVPDMAIRETTGSEQGHSVVSRINSTKSIAFSAALASPNDNTNDTGAAGASRPFRRVASSAVPRTTAKQPPSFEHSASCPADVEMPRSSKGTFAGLRFRVLGDASSPTLLQALRGEGAIIVTTPWAPRDESALETDYIIVRLVSAAPHFSAAAEQIRPLFRTECWVERCIFEERIVEAREHITYCPLAIGLPVQGAERVNLHLSAHDPSETLFLQRLARTLGLTISSSLTKGTTTHLVVPTDEGKKYEKALEWNIKVVRADWLHAIAVTGVIPGIGGPQAGNGSSAPSSGDVPMLDADLGHIPLLPSSNTLVAPTKPRRRDQPTSQAALLFLRDPKSGLFGTEMPEDDAPIRPQARRHRGLPPRNRARPGGHSQINPLTSSPASSVSSFAQLAPSSPAGDNKWGDSDPESTHSPEDVQVLEESMRVMYEDPEQNAEKKRLLLLLENE